SAGSRARLLGSVEPGGIAQVADAGLPSGERLDADLDNGAGGKPRRAIPRDARCRRHAGGAAKSAAAWRSGPGPRFGPRGASRPGARRNAAGDAALPVVLADPRR